MMLTAAARRAATTTLAAALLATGTGTALAAAPTAGSAHAAPARTAVSDRSPAVSWVQHGATATASVRGHRVAEVRYRYLSGDAGHARLTLSVTAQRPFVLHTTDLVWEDATGQHTPDADSQVAVRVRPSRTAQRVDVTYTGTGPGAVVYAPGTQVAAVWPTS